MAKTKRNSGVELLRIIIMLQIVIIHLYAYGNLTTHANAHGGLTNYFFDALQSLCRAPVNIFILISGYFLVDTEFNLKRTFKRAATIWLAMLFYSLALLVFHYSKVPSAISVPETIKAFFPFFSRRWYFLSIYLVILIFSPFLNILLQKLDKKNYLIFLGLVFMLMSVWSSLANVEGVKQVISIDKIVGNFMGKSVPGQLLLYTGGGI